MSQHNPVLQEQEEEKKDRKFIFTVSIWFVLALILNFFIILIAGCLASNTRTTGVIPAGMIAQSTADYSANSDVVFAPLDPSIIDQVLEDSNALQLTPDDTTNSGIIPIGGTVTMTPIPSTNTPIPTFTATAVPVVNTPPSDTTPSATPTATVDQTGTATVTATPSPTPFSTATPTNTPIILPTVTFTPVPTNPPTQPPPPPPTQPPPPPPTQPPPTQPPPPPPTEPPPPPPTEPPPPTPTQVFVITPIPTAEP